MIAVISETAKVFVDGIRKSLGRVV
jgi:hypothetical protein